MLPRIARLRQAYARGFRARHFVALAWRGPTRVHVLDDPRAELAAKVSYVHANPVKAGEVEVGVEWPWSSAREYARLSFAGFAAVERAREIATRPLAEPRPGPACGPARRSELAAMLAAAAQVMGIAPEEIRRGGRIPATMCARRAFVDAAIRDGWRQDEVAAFLDLTEGRVSQLANAPGIEPIAEAVLALVRDPRLRRWLPEEARAPIAPS